jgi:hypothetical protein
MDKRGKDSKRKPAAPKVAATRLPPHPKPGDPQHVEWLIDEAEDESFPASDPSAIAQPHPKPRKKE